jgi:hypothetical protein
MIQVAQGYATERVNRAQGDVARFKSVLEEYRKAPEVTRERLYYEMMDSVFGKQDTIAETASTDSESSAGTALNAGTTTASSAPAKSGTAKSTVTAPVVPTVTTVKPAAKPEQKTILIDKGLKSFLPIQDLNK